MTSANARPWSRRFWTAPSRARRAPGEIADLLKLPASPDCVVVAAEVPDLAREALPGAESRLMRKDIAVRRRQLRPEIQVGIACLKNSTSSTP